MLLKGGPPPLHPPPLSARRLCKIRTHQNVEVYGRSEDEAQRKCILQAEKHYALAKKTLRRTFGSLGKTVFSPFGRKKEPFFLRKQKFASEFFCPCHNVSSQKEHIFCMFPCSKEHLVRAYLDTVKKTLIILRNSFSKRHTVAVHLRAVALMETHHFFSKGHST